MCLAGDNAKLTLRTQTTRQRVLVNRTHTQMYFCKRTLVTLSGNCISQNGWLLFKMWMHLKLQFKFSFCGSCLWFPFVILLSLIIRVLLAVIYIYIYVCEFASDLLYRTKKYNIYALISDVKMTFRFIANRTKHHSRQPTHSLRWVMMVT